ncbi:11297_t:CDS:2, partial [Funneliformis geosporum]
PVIMSTIDTAKDTDKGTWRKRFITRLEKIVNDDTYICYDSFAQPKECFIPALK